MPIVTDVLNCDSRSRKLNCGKLNDSERKRYCDLTSEQLSAISVPDAVHCTNVDCSDPVNIEETTRFYIAILGSLQDASSSVFQQAGCLDSAFTFVLLMLKTSCSPHFLIIYTCVLYG